MTASDTAEKPSIFISYSRKQIDLAKQLYERLTNEGFDVWWDIEVMPSRGVEFTGELRMAIEDVNHLVLLWSTNARDSEYVELEWKHALSAGVCVPVHPVLVEDGEYDDLPEELKNIDTRDLRNVSTYEKEMQTLIRQLLEPAIPLAEIHGMESNEFPLGYVEREIDLATLRDHVLDTTGKDVVVSGKTIALQGIGGIGKTVLAQALVNECDVRRRYKDGIFWITVGKDPVIPSLQQFIGTTFGDAEENYLPAVAKASLHRVLNNKKVLLVLDNVWETVHAQGFQVGGKDCRVLVTTRKTSLHTTLDAVNQPLESLTEDECMELIRKRVKREPEDDNPHDATEREIVRLLERHTGAINVVAGRLALRGEHFAEKLLQRLTEKKNTPDPFKDLTIPKEDQEFNLWASLMESYEDWDETRKKHFRQLGVTAPDSQFDESLAAQIWDIEDVDEADDELAALEQAGMLTREEKHYAMHNLLRTFACALVLRDGDYDVAWVRYVDGVIGLLRQLYPISSMAERQELKADPHILYVGDILVEGFDKKGKLLEQMSRFGDLVANFLSRRREIQLVKYDSWLFIALDAIREVGDRTGEATTLNNIGSVHNALGQKQKALDFYNQALIISREVDDRTGEATTLNNMGSVYNALGQNLQALDFYNQALTIFQEIGNRSGEAATLNNIGSIYDDLGQKLQALNFYNQGLDIIREIGNRTNEAGALTNIGSVYGDLGQKQLALDFYNRALPIRREVGDRSGEATTLNNIGSIYDDLGQKLQALNFYNQALIIRREVGDRSGEATTLNNIGGIYDILEQKLQALDFYNLALPIRREVGDRSGEAITLNNIGRVYNSLGELQQALDFYNQALTIFREVGDRSNEATTLNNIGSMHRDLGQPQQALDFLYQALTIRHEVDDRSGEAVTCYNIGMIWAEAGELDLAIAFVERCVQLDIEVQHPELESDRNTLEQLKQLRAKRDQ